MINKNPFSLEGKTIIVTGASSGIGEATALECAGLGANVILVARNIERLKSVYDRLENGKHSYVSLDLTVKEEVDKFISTVDKVDGVVHGSGIVETIPFLFAKREKFDNIFDINFFAPVYLSQQLIRKKKVNQGSSIVFVSSIDGNVTAHIGNSVYSASKAAVSSITKSMAIELAPKGIRVNAVVPGMTNTPLIHTDGISDEQLLEDAKLYPFKRYAEPVEIALPIVFLLSGASSFITGENLVIDGGFTIL